MIQKFPTKQTNEHISTQHSLRAIEKLKISLLFLHLPPHRKHILMIIIVQHIKPQSTQFLIPMIRAYISFARGFTLWYLGTFYLREVAAM
jgi:hypothetical protein